MAIIWLADVLRRAGVAVVEEGNWQARGVAGSFAPIGVLWHHTAATSSPGNPAPALGICINGRQDLQGPLCHALVDYNGVFHVISANRANHAGASGGSGPIPSGDGNTMLVGWEIDYNGVSQSMTAAQYSASVRATAAVLRALGKDANHARGHRETSTTGKIDPGGIDLNAMRADVARRMHGVAISDWSGDGYADVLGVDSAGDLWYYANNGLKLSARKKLGAGWATFRHVKAADWSGDGYADVIGADAAGDLWYYPHSGNGLGARKKIGEGWKDFRHVAAADWSGDGYADVIGADAAGDLWYYPHNGNGLGARQKIGAGWKDFRHVVAADWSGDGYADVIGADAAGDLWYYPHNGNGLGVRQKIGAGWKDFRFVRAMDFSGDGYADVIGVDAAGDMWYYPHNGNGLGARKKIGAGWANFTHIL